MKLLPQTRSLPSRVVVMSMTVGCLWFAVAFLRMAIAGQYSYGVWSFVLWLPLATGLWLLMPWARYVALLILWTLVIGLPTGVGPFEAMNGDSPPGSVWEPLMYTVAPLFIPSAVLIELLYAYRGEFTAGPERPATMLPRSWLLWFAAMFAVPALLAQLLTLNVQRNGGCIPLEPALRHEGGYVWSFLCVALGLLAFLCAAPPAASRLNKAVRALVYVAGMLYFCSNISGYLFVANPCPLKGG